MLTGREPFYRTFAKCVARLAACPLVLDLGTPEPFSDELSKLRQLFTRSRYVTMDYPFSTDPLAIDVAGDIHHLPFQDGVADGVICKEVLEHVDNPFQAVEEIYRVIRPGGLLFLTVPFLEPYHGRHGSYEDYWRFTQAGIRRLLRRFRQVEVEMYGGVPYLLVTAYAPRLRRLLFSWGLGWLFWTVDRRFRRSSTILHMVLAEK